MKKNLSFIFFKYKKANVGVTTFSLILLILILLLGFVLFFSNGSKANLIEKNSRSELLNSLSSFRGEMIKLLSHNGSSINYQNNYDLNEIYFVINASENIILGYHESDSSIININISTLGFRFCTDFEYSPTVIAKFSYNGSCIDISTI